MACVEMSYPTALRVKEDGAIETIGTFDFEGKLRHQWTAHPKIDPVTNEMMTFCYNIDKAPFAQYSVIDSEGNHVRTLDLDLPKAVMMHDCTITANHTIFMVRCVC